MCTHSPQYLDFSPIQTKGIFTLHTHSDITPIRTMVVQTAVILVSDGAADVMSSM
jgi:hypothetical protein